MSKLRVNGGGGVLLGKTVDFKSSRGSEDGGGGNNVNLLSQSDWAAAVM